MKWSKPFDPKGLLIWVGARLTGHDGKKRDLVMALDPGSEMTSVDVDLASSIGLTKDRKIANARLRGSDGEHKAYVIPAPRLEVFGRSVENISIACNPLPTHHGVQGLLGLDFFRGTDLCIRFKTGIIELED